ncbi:aminoglycoside phosphotransferase family protein [Terrarubrum flagellatum]|uniref:aminoglycoside phosphotransferase family protein n=1 Tax=Terrirubrum flagellatum TaxID=2895980 RepID=UPI0031453041
MSPPNPPDAKLAAGIAESVIGRAPIAVRRFMTGARHYVFEVEFADHAPVVARLGVPSARAEMEGALYLSGLLRPLGVPLPRILAEDVRAEYPWLLLERLPGTDLGAVISGLSQAQCEAIAGRVAQTQAIAAKTASTGRFGYAVRPEQAPHATWFDALAAHLARSRRRIVSAGLFDVALIDVAQAEMSALRSDIDHVAPTPFLHDTTTKNVIVTPEGEFSGVVDVDDLCFGDPRYPAALTWAVLKAYGGPLDYVSAWLQRAELPDDRLFRLYVSLFLLDLMGEHGHVFNGNIRPSTPEARAALRQAFEESIG